MILIIALLILFTVLTVFTTIFVVACRLAGMNPPGTIRSACVVIATAAVWAVIEAAFVAGLRKIYAITGNPQWEVWIVGLFAGFPVSLAAGCFLHKTLMRVSLSKAIEVWFFERMIRYGFVLAGLGLAAVAWLAMK
ncbi:hypothetical protein BH11PLA2_BH11PLA2_23880 [soil metagenome]